jgi:hypothetical protein
VQEKVETQGTGELYVVSGPYRESLLDRDRIASMADEGGAAAAEMDLIEQLSVAPLVVRRTDRSWPVRVLVGALVMGVAAVITRMLVSGRPRARARWFKLR